MDLCNLRAAASLPKVPARVLSLLFAFLCTLGSEPHDIIVGSARLYVVEIH